MPSLNESEDVSLPGESNFTMIYIFRLYFIKSVDYETPSRKSGDSRVNTKCSHVCTINIPPNYFVLELPCNLMSLE